MFTGNHFMYKSSIVNDMQIRVQAPKEVADYISRNESFFKSEENLGREGGDYVTESENCHPKNHLSPDVSSPQS